MMEITAKTDLMVNQKRGQPVGAQQEVGRALHVSLEHREAGEAGEAGSLRIRLPTAAEIKHQ